MRLRHVQPTGKLEVVARADGGARSAWAATGAADLADVRLEELEDRLLRRLGWAERKIELEPGRYEVVIPPDAVADLDGAGRRRDLRPRGRGGAERVLRAGRRHRVGESLSPHPFTLRSDPLEPGLECDAVSRHVGVGPGRVCLRQRSPARSAPIGSPVVGSRDCSTTARRRNDRVPEPAAPIDNLILELPGATGGLDDLVARTERGLLLTCLWYIREVDPSTLLLTGLTRDGVYLVEQRRDRRVRSTTSASTRARSTCSSKTIEGGQDRAGALAGVERVDEPDGDAIAARGGLQHELGEPRDLTRVAAAGTVAAEGRSYARPG